MNALRWLILGLTLMLAACTSRPAVRAIEAPQGVAVAATANGVRTPAELPEEASDASSTLVELVRRVRKEPKVVAVFRPNECAPRSAGALKRAGFDVRVLDEDFGRVDYRSQRYTETFDVIVVESAPSADWYAPAWQFALIGIPVIATWSGAPTSELAAGFELVEQRGGRTTHFVLWDEDSVDGTGLTARPARVRGIEFADGDNALVVGTLFHYGSPNERAEAFIDIPYARGRTQVVLHGPGAAKLAARAKSMEENAASIVAVRGRLHFTSVMHPTTYWEMEVEDVRLDLDDSAVRSMSTRHARLYDRALQHVAADQLALAANDLEAAAKLVDDTLGGLGELASRAVRFDRLMARRLREAAALGGGGMALVDRVASFDRFASTEPSERTLLQAAARLARKKLMSDYRTKPDAEAELAARAYLYAAKVMNDGLTPARVEMGRRFPALVDFPNLFDPQFYDEGESEI